MSYPPGFRDWPEERRNAYFAEAAREYRLARADDAPRPAEREVVASSFADRHELPAVVTLKRASDLEAAPITWVWPGWLARGKAHIIGGQPGAGKTTLAMKFAATVTTGGRWPDGTTATRGNVILWSGEDDPADTLVPRLAASGADLGRVFFVEDVIEGKERRAFDPAKDIGPLKQAIEAGGGAVLLVVDPIVSAVAGDSHKNSETRRSLQPLLDLASSVGAALLGVTHFSKGTSGREPIERITGSIAFGALARVVMVAAKEPEADDGTAGRRILARAKSNIGPDEGGYAYSLELVPMPGRSDINASVAVWRERIDGTARDMLAVAESTDDDGEVNALNEAKNFLLDFLADGPKPAKECKAAAAEAALSWATVRRAQDKLGIKPAKDSMTGGWTWSLPEGAHQNTKMLTQESLSTFGSHEHLRGESLVVTNDLGDAVTDGWKDEI
jgi:hypothetical protein